MTLADQISHIASVASWKVKQQGQIIHLQGQINDFESQIGIQKTLLAEQTYKLFLEGAITEDPLVSLCLKIKDLYAQKAEKQQELEILRAQTPPEQPKTEPTPPVSKAPNATEPIITEALSETVIRVEPLTVEKPPEVAEPAAPKEASGWVEPGVSNEPPAPTDQN